MKTSPRMFEILMSFGFSSLLILASNPAAAQSAPGEDPVILTKRVSTLQLPDAGQAKSKPMDNPEMPASLRAKVARFEAQANADSVSSFSTDKDVTRETSSDGFKKTCIQEVGSNTGSGGGQGLRPGQTNNQQIVVLRGDLVNICK